MPMPLLATKLYIPPARPNLIPRPYLTQRLNESLNRKLTLISAPAGFGKTTLLSEWIHRPVSSDPQPARVAWLSLDRHDNDLARFWTYVLTSLQVIQAELGEACLAMLQSPQPPSLETILPVLINEMVALSTHSVLILDDYHLIETQVIHEGLIFLLDHLPPAMHVIIAGRADPPLPLARLRARGELIEFRAADLRLTLEETTLFLTEVMRFHLSSQDVAALEARIEGWAAGLQLAALSMQGRQDLASFVAAFTGSHRYLVDYLTEEVLQYQPENVQTFLLATSILDHLCGPLCDVVVAAFKGPDLSDQPETPPSELELSISNLETKGQAILEKLEKANLFITPLDDERRWYRYHPLLADLLRQRLRELVGPARLAALHQRAMDWYDQNGFIAEAINHALAAEDFQQAARLVEQVGRKMWMKGELATLLNWLKALPEPVIRTRPKLCLIYAWALFPTRQLAVIETWLQAADYGPGPSQNSKRELGLAGTDYSEIPLEVSERNVRSEIQGEIAAIRATVARMRGQVDHTIQLAHQALENLAEDNLTLRGVMALNLGYSYRQNGNAVAASRAFAEAKTLSQATDNIYVTLIASHNLAKLQTAQGHLHEAAGIYRQALQLAAERGGQHLPVTSMAHIGLGKLLYEWNDLAAATTSLLAGIERNRQGNFVGMLLEGYLTLARVKQGQGDAKGVLYLLQEVEQLATSNISNRMSRVAAWQARLRLAQGDLTAARGWAQASGLNVNDELHPSREVEYLTLARVLTVYGELTKAMRLLERLLKEAEAAERIRSVIEILVLQALAWQTESDRQAPSRAIVSLTRALSLAEPEGYIRLFVDQGPALAELLRNMKADSLSGGRDGRMQAYIQRLLVAFEKDAGERLRDGDLKTEDRNFLSSTLDPQASILYRHASIASLSERELEVLRRVAAGASNQEIAQEIVVTIHTVKKHVSHILRKLEVTSRTQAVARARELGLI